MKKKIIAIILIIAIAMNSFLVFGATTSFNNLSSEDKNDLTLLNYLVMLSTRINNEDNNRLYLDNIYRQLENNSNPAALNDDEAFSYLTTLFDTISKYKIVNKKRERLSYIYNQNKANTIYEALPNPIGVLSAATSNDKKKLIATIVYMAINAKTSYDSANNRLDMKYLQDNWELDDEQEAVIVENTKATIQTRRDIVKRIGVEGSASISPDGIKEFLSKTKTKNYQEKVSWLETQKDTYYAFGDYWLEIADAYYRNASENNVLSDYAKCINAIKEYENLSIKFLNKQHELARVLPLVIDSIESSGSNQRNYSEIEHYCELIIKNVGTDDDEWDLKYFAAQTYLSLYNETNNVRYLQNAYNIAYESTLNLIDKQKDKNKEFLSDLKLEEVPKKAKTKQEKSDKKDIENFNKLLKEERKKATPPIYAPLLVTCDLLFKTADLLKINQSEKEKIDRVLHHNNEDLFLIEQIDDLFRYKKKERPERKLVFDGKTLIIPACYTSNQPRIEFKVIDNKGKVKISCYDFDLERVERNDNGIIDSIFSEYTSPTIKKYKFDIGDIVDIVVYPMNNVETKPVIKKFEVSKDGMLPFLKKNKFN